MEQGNGGKGMAIASLVLGIISLVLAWFGYSAIVGLILSIVGIVLSVMSKKKGPSGMATAGLVLSIIGVVLNGLMVACVACAAATICSAASMI